MGQTARADAGDNPILEIRGKITRLRPLWRFGKVLPEKLIELRRVTKAARLVLFLIVSKKSAQASNRRASQPR
jgi:hypothetical protein